MTAWPELSEIYPRATKRADTGVCHIHVGHVIGYCPCCCLPLKTVPMYARTCQVPTDDQADADGFRGHKLCTPKKRYGNETIKHDGWETTVLL